MIGTATGAAGGGASRWRRAQRTRSTAAVDGVSLQVVDAALPWRMIAASPRRPITRGDQPRHERRELAGRGWASSGLARPPDERSRFVQPGCERDLKRGARRPVPSSKQQSRPGLLRVVQGARRQRRPRARSSANGGVARLMHTAVATSLTPSETDASTDATARPRPALVLAYGTEHVPRIRRARTVRSVGRRSSGRARAGRLADPPWVRRARCRLRRRGGQARTARPPSERGKRRDATLPIACGRRAAKAARRVGAGSAYAPRHRRESRRRRLVDLRA
jgi:hypothetical protein